MSSLSSRTDQRLLAKDWSLTTLGSGGGLHGSSSSSSLALQQRRHEQHRQAPSQRGPSLFHALAAHHGAKRLEAVTHELSKANGVGAEAIGRMRDGRGYSVLAKALLLAVEPGVLELLVNFGAAVDSVEPGGLRILHTLVKHQRPRELALLLKLGGDWRALEQQSGGDSDTALDYAIRRWGSIVLTGGAGRAGSGGDSGPEGGATWTHFEAQRTRMIRILVLSCPEGRRAAVDFRNPKTGRTALHTAAAMGDAATAAFLLDEGGAWVDAPDSRGHTSLWVAASKGNAAVAAVLLDHGAVVDAAGRERSTPLRVAARNGGVVDERKKKPAVDAEDNGIKHGYAQVVALLVARGAVLSLASITRSEAVTTTQKALSGIGSSNANDSDRSNSVSSGAALLKAVDLNAAHPETGRTALHAAAVAGNATLVRLLLETLTLRDQGSSSSNNPGHHVSSHRQGGALNVNAKDSSGQTPLALAAFECVEPLTPHRMHTDGRVRADDNIDTKSNRRKKKHQSSSGSNSSSSAPSRRLSAAVAIADDDDDDDDDDASPATTVQCLLIEHGASLGRSTSEVDHLVWQNAALPRRAKVLRALSATRHGADSIKKRGACFFGCPALWIAAAKNNVAALQTLLEAGANPNRAFALTGPAQGISRYLPGGLKKGVVMGRGECSKLALVDGSGFVKVNLPKEQVGKGGSGNLYQSAELWARTPQSVQPPEVPDPDGTTALHQAAVKGHLKAASLLLTFDAAVDARALLTSLPHSKIHSDRKDQKRSSPKAYTDHDSNDGGGGGERNSIGGREGAFDGWTALHFAAAVGDADMCSLLLDHDATVDAKDSSGITPLVRCCISDMPPPKAPPPAFRKRTSTMATEPVYSTQDAKGRSLDRKTASFVRRNGASNRCSDARSNLLDSKSNWLEKLRAVMQCLVDAGADPRAVDSSLGSLRRTAMQLAADRGIAIPRPTNAMAGRSGSERRQRPALHRSS